MIEYRRVEKISVLLIEDVDDHAEIISTLLKKIDTITYEIKRVATLAAGINESINNHFDVILLDLNLPDSGTNETLFRMLNTGPYAPIIVLSSIHDRELALKSIQNGAQDYLCKSDLTPELLRKSITYAIERRQIQRKVQEQDERLKESIEKMKQEQQKKDEFLATLSHELRSPLNVILGYADLLSEYEPNSPDFKVAIDAIIRNAKTEARLVEDVLDISRMITGKFKLQKKKFLFKPVVDSAIEPIEFAAEAKKIKVRRQYLKEDVLFYGDEDRIRQIIWNLLSNAIKFTPEGGEVCIRIFLSGSNLVIEVEDSGFGIEAKNIPYVFQRFWQEDSTLGRLHTGLGLGLAIVRHMTELHGGLAQVTSPGHGKGSKFTITLPLIENTALDAIEERVRLKAEHDIEVSAPIDRYNVLKGLDILLIDDDDDARRLVDRILVRAGASVQSVDNAIDGLEKIKSNDYHLVISDIGMPVCDGFNLMRKLRSWESELKRKNVRAIALTAFASESDNIKAMQSGYNGFIAKPFKRDVLLESIKKII